MSENNNRTEQYNDRTTDRYDDNGGLSETAGNWLGWIGVILAIIGFFWQPVWMGVIAVILGIIGLFSPKKGVNWAAIILGVIVLIVGLA